MPGIVIAEGFEEGTDGVLFNSLVGDVPGLTYGLGFFKADPHTGGMAAMLQDADAGSGSGACTRAQVVEEVSEVGVFAKFLPTTPGPGEEFSHRVSIGWKHATASTPLSQIWCYFELDGSLVLRVTDSTGAPIDTVAISDDTWYQFSYKANGDWSVLDGSTVVISGNNGATPDGRALLAGVDSETAPGRIVFDDFYYVPADPSSPPRRLYPRSDGLGVGVGRAYPHHRSQQRSGRVAGGYF